jgi:type III secretion protein Y
VTQKRRDSVEFLHGLGYLYCQAGQPERGLVFLLLAARIAPEDTAVLRSLAAVFVETESASRALTAIDRIEDIEGGSSPSITLLKSRAQWIKGDEDNARETFRDYLKERQPA